MSHTVHPYSHRLGIIKDWKSRWFGVNKKYRDALKADITIREYLKKRTRGMYIGGIEISPYLRLNAERQEEQKKGK